MKNPKAAVLIVEDDPAILNGLLDVMIFNGYQAVGVEDGRKGLEKGLREPYDLILLDVMLPTMDGFSICRKIRRKKPNQGIIMLTAKGAEEDIVTGFRAGADDYVSKPFSLQELMVRIEALFRRMGKNPGDVEISCRGMIFKGKTLQASCNEKSMALTRREMDIIAYLYQHQDRIVPKHELLTKVWHYSDAGIETRTVDIHILKLRKKIASLIGDIPFILTIRGEGYRLEPGA